jgi:hypothetical protein
MHNDSDKVKAHVIGRPCSIHRKLINKRIIFVRKLKGKDHSVQKQKNKKP